MKILTGKERLAIIAPAIIAAHEIIKYKEYLKKDLFNLKRLHLELEVGLIDIAVKERNIRERITKLQKYISTRFSLLLNYYEQRVFCEAIELENGNFEINPESVTSNPINQLGSVDLKRGYIILTQVKMFYNPPNSPQETRLELQPLRLDLQDATIIENYLKEI